MQNLFKPETKKFFESVCCELHSKFVCEKVLILCFNLLNFIQKIRFLYLT